MPSGLRHIMALTGNAMSWAHGGGQVGTPTASCLGSVGCRPPAGDVYTQRIGWEALGCRSALRILICFILKLLCKEDTEEEFSLQRLTR